MYCSKCKYTSFDNLGKCPKCGDDWSELKKKINLEWVGHNDTPWLEIGEEEFASARDSNANLISGFDDDEDIDFSFDENGAGDDLEEMISDADSESKVKPPSEENIIDYFGEEESSSEEPVLEFGLEEFENRESTKETRDEDEQEIDISQLEWEEDELDTRNLDSSPQASPPEKAEPEEEEEADLGDLDLEGIEIPENEISAEREDKTPAGDTHADPSESEDLDIDLGGGQTAGTQTSQPDAEPETPSPEEMDEDELIADLSSEDVDDNIPERAAAEEDAGKKTESGGNEMDGDIDYPELDLFEEEK